MLSVSWDNSANANTYCGFEGKVLKNMQVWQTNRKKLFYCHCFHNEWRCETPGTVNFVRQVVLFQYLGIVVQSWNFKDWMSLRWTRNDILLCLHSTQVVPTKMDLPSDFGGKDLLENWWNTSESFRGTHLKLELSYYLIFWQIVLMK